ncbi:hypothetical protein BDW68DRAFT_178501 [Aspergillus falconensis]
MSSRNPTQNEDSTSSVVADKRFFDEANATFQSDGGWYDPSVPDTAMTSRATQGSRYQRPYLDEDEGDLIAEADAAMDANPGLGSYLDEQPILRLIRVSGNGVPLFKREHLAEVQCAPAARHVGGIEGDDGRDPTESQATQLTDKHARPSSESLDNGAGLEETWTDTDSKEFMGGRDVR